MGAQRCLLSTAEQGTTLSNAPLPPHGPLGRCRGTGSETKPSWRLGWRTAGDTERAEARWLEDGSVHVGAREQTVQRCMHEGSGTQTAGRARPSPARLTLRVVSEWVGSAMPASLNTRWSIVAAEFTTGTPASHRKDTSLLTAGSGPHGHVLPGGSPAATGTLPAHDHG